MDNLKQGGTSSRYNQYHHQQQQHRQYTNNPLPHYRFPNQINQTAAANLYSSNIFPFSQLGPPHQNQNPGNNFNFPLRSASTSTSSRITNNNGSRGGGNNGFPRYQHVNNLNRNQTTPVTVNNMLSFQNPATATTTISTNLTGPNKKVYNKKINSPENPSTSISSTLSQEEKQPQYRIFKRGDTLTGEISPEKEKNISSESMWVNEVKNKVTSNGTGTTTTGSLDQEKEKDKENKLTSSTSSPSKDKKSVKWKDESPTRSEMNHSSQKVYQNKTHVSTVADIAKFHGLEVEYKLTSEVGPAHQPRFNVTLTLGDEKYDGQGTSIKKAQHSAALVALQNTKLSQPSGRRFPSQHQPKRNYQQNSSIIGGRKPAERQQQQRRPNYALLQLQALCDEFNEKLSFSAQPIPIMDPFNRLNHQNLINTSPAIVIIRVGDCEYISEGINYNAAKHACTILALKAMLKIKQEKELAKLEELGLTPAQLEEKSILDDNKSPISIVHEMAMKRGLTITFETEESGPAHKRSFVVECTAGEHKTVGTGCTKQEGKKVSSEKMIEKLKEVPLNITGVSLKNIQRALLNKPKLTRKKQITPVVKEIEKQIVSPISRLIQISHIKKYKEPVFNLIESPPTEESSAEKDKMPSERKRNRKAKPIFVIEVIVGPLKCQGRGSNKKDAKNNAANEALCQMGYPPTVITVKPKENQNNEKEVGVGSKKSAKKDDKKDSKSRHPNPNHNQQSVIEKSEKTNKIQQQQQQSNSNSNQQNNLDKSTNGVVVAEIKLTSPRQIVPGVFVINSNETSPKTDTLLAQPSVQQKMIAKNASFLLSDNSYENMKKLEMLAEMFTLKIQICDFPKKNEYLSVVTLNTNPPQVAHGVGKSLEEAQNQASLKILQECAEINVGGQEPGDEAAK